MDCFYKLYSGLLSVRAAIRWHLKIDPIGKPIEVDGVLIRVPYSRVAIITSTLDGSYGIYDCSFEMRWFLTNRGTDYDEFVTVLSRRFDVPESHIKWIEFIKVTEDNHVETIMLEEAPSFNTIPLVC